MLAGEGVPRVWNLALSPNKAYAAVVQSVPGEQRKLQVHRVCLNKGSYQARTVHAQLQH